MRSAYVRTIDWGLLGSALLLMGMGLLALWTYAPPVDLKDAPLQSVFFKQAMFAAIALGLMVAGLIPSYFALRHAAVPLYVGGVALLVALLFLGQKTNGARGWFQFGTFKFQPAEFMKIVLVLALARHLMYAKRLDRPAGLVLPVAMTALPTLLVLMQPDLGTALLFFPALLTMLFAAGARTRHLLAFVAAALLAAPFVYRFGMKDYQRHRLTSFLTPEKVDKKYSYQQTQSVRATAAGGATGRGIGDAAVSGAIYIPERHNDFIFSITAQDLGFAGSTFVLLLFAIFLLRSLGIAHASREPFGRLVAVGLSTILALQIFINVGMTIGVAPITGLTLPFMSYGGSSLLTCALSTALLLNIGSRWVPSFGGRERGADPVFIRGFDPGRKFPV